MINWADDICRPGKRTTIKTLPAYVYDSEFINKIYTSSWGVEDKWPILDQYVWFDILNNFVNSNLIVTNKDRFKDEYIYLLSKIKLVTKDYIFELREDIYKLLLELEEVTLPLLFITEEYSEELLDKYRLHNYSNIFGDYCLYRIY